MKEMTCKQLGGACEMVFRANTFEEVAELARAHGMEMFQTGDADHLQAMGKIQELMMTPDGMQKWMDEKKREFDALPESE